MAHDDEDAYRETRPEPFCHAPGGRCVTVGECYSNKRCQYEPSDQHPWDNMTASIPRGLL